MRHLLFCSPTYNEESETNFSNFMLRLGFHLVSRLLAQHVQSPGHHPQNSRLPYQTISTVPVSSRDIFFSLWPCVNALQFALYFLFSKGLFFLSVVSFTLVLKHTNPHLSPLQEIRSCTYVDNFSFASASVSEQREGCVSPLSLICVPNAALFQKQSITYFCVHFLKI